MAENKRRSHKAVGMAKAFAGSTMRPKLDDGSHLIKLGTAGRLVIPEPLRRALGLSEGDALRLRIERGRLVVATPSANLNSLQDMLSEQTEAGAGSLVDELIADRREESKRVD